ncbi:MAG TPA: oxaloacetate decarboxylase [Ramlibacter sp.]|uniref:isocitrate lyase/PEP mutase family protein n=1 Tax=Ramlibacter sp. TaxID=1917967 RepID=UPI002ED050AD
MASSRRERFRELVARPELLVLPGAYDALSARIAETQGFQAITAGGYAAVGSMLAQPDMGQSNMRDYAAHYARICQAVDVPVYVDADTGFGGVHNVRETVRAFEAAGIAGMFISDQVFPNRCGYLAGKSVIPQQEMVAKVRAAIDARQDPAFFICARTDAAAVEGVDAALDRCRAYLAAGADSAKPQGLDTEAEIRRAIAEVPGPHFGTLSQAAGKGGLPLQALQALGVAAVTLPSLALFAAARAVSQAFSEFSKRGDVAGLQDKLMPLDQYYELVRLQQFAERERAYLEPGGR